MDWKVRCREKRKLPLNKRLPVIMDAICFINGNRSSGMNQVCDILRYMKTGKLGCTYFSLDFIANKRDNYRCVAYPFYLYYTIGEKPQPIRQ